MILVAGGTGFIGSAIVRALITRGEQVTVMSHQTKGVVDRFPGLNVGVRQGDARDAESLTRAVAGMQTVVSCMQFPNFPVEKRSEGYTFDEVDARGNERLVQAAKAAGVRNYVYLSGSGAAPDAAKHWFRAKWQAEQAIQKSGLRYSIFRPSWVYGPADKSLNRFVTFAKLLPVVPVIGDGNQRMQPVFVDDVVRCAVGSLSNEKAANQVFEIGGPDVMSMNEVLRVMLRVMGKKKPLVHQPAALFKLIGAAMTPLPKPPLSPDAIDFITNDALADTSGLLQAFDIRLTPLREGLNTYLAAGK